MIYTPVIRTFIITRITHSVSNILRLLYTCFTFYSNERFRTIYAVFLTAVCVYTPVLYENKKQEKLAFCLFETFARYSDSARSVNSSILARYYRDKIFRYSLSFFFLFSFLSRRSSFIAIRSTPAVSNIFHDPPPFPLSSLDRKSHSLGRLITVKRVYCTAYRLATRSQFQAALAPRFTKVG